MRKTNVYSLEGEKIKEINLPAVFETKIKEHLVLRAFISHQAAKKQPQGRNPLAGNRRIAESLGTGRGMARVPRLKNSTRAAKVPGAVGGRRAHPPKPEKVIREKINKKERREAIKSAIAATASKELVTGRGHLLDPKKSLPLVVEDKIQEVKETSEVREIFKKLGLWDDVLRCKKRWRKERAGKGKMRGRRRKHAKGPLIVVNKDLGIKIGARCLPGVDVTLAKDLSCEQLAPGGKPGRLTVWSESAINWLKSREGERSANNI